MRPKTPQDLTVKEVITLDIGAKYTPPPIVSSRKVLLLEDRDDFREVIRDYLVSRSYEVISANSGIEGLRMIMNDGGFDVILCDMLMPRMGGEMFYWAVTRARPGTRQRFIFFTGHKNNPRIEFFFRRINATVLYKPFKLSVLDAAISDVFRKSG